jgi:hypothetical protein
VESRGQRARAFQSIFAPQLPPYCERGYRMDQAARTPPAADHYISIDPTIYTQDPKIPACPPGKTGQSFPPGVAVAAIDAAAEAAKSSPAGAALASMSAGAGAARASMSSSRRYRSCTPAASLCHYVSASLRLSALLQKHMHRRTRYLCLHAYTRVWARVCTPAAP